MCTHTHAHTLCPFFSLYFLSLSHTYTDTQSLSLSLTHPTVDVYQGNPKRHHTLQTAHTHTHTHTHYLSLSLSLLFYHLSLTHTHSLSFTLTHTPVDVYPGNPKKHHTLQVAHAHVGQMLLGSHRPPGLDE